MHKIYLPFLLLMVTYVAQAQNELSNFNATGRAGVSTTLNTDYQCVGINPANLGLKRRYETKHITFGLGEFATNAYMQGVTYNDVKKYFKSGLTYQEQTEAVQLFTDKEFTINTDVNIFGFAVQADKLGGFAFNVRDQFRESHKMSQATSDFLFHGSSSSVFFDKLLLTNGSVVANDPNNYSSLPAPIDSVQSSSGFSLGQVANGTYVKAQWYREYSLSYGREFINKNDGEFTLAGGLSLKYIQGIAYIDIKGENNRIHGLGAFSQGFQLDNYFTFVQPKNVNTKNFSPLGGGYGIDFGLTATLKEHLRFGASVTNIGQVVYKTNAYEIQDTVIKSVDYSTSGFNGFDISNDLIKWKGVDKITTKLPATLRMGASLHLLDNKVDLGMDIVIPLNKVPGAYNHPLISIGGDLYPVRWFKVSTGMYIGGNTAAKFNLPLGVGIIAGENGTYEFGVATRDIISYIKPEGPSYSAAMGFLRFRF
jgi:hypothetical protein